jgi:HAD superfamily hydrolase (TIGR01509 family)
LPALIFDCDGVLADTERDGHRPAFNQAFAEAGLDVTWDEEEYGRRLKIGGGKERIASLFDDAGAERDRIAALHKRKTAIYKEIVRSGRLPGRPGVARIVDEALAAGWTLAVASTSAEESVRAVLEHVVGPDTAARFAVFAGDVVPAKKPDPGIYLLTLEELGVAADDAIVVEDSRNGLLAAVGAGLRCVVTLSSYTGEEDMREAALVLTSLGDPGAPARVVANRSAAHPGDRVTIADLEACLNGPLSDEEAT